MKYASRILGGLFLIFLSVKAGSGAQIVKTDDYTLNLGFRFQSLGELSLVTDDPVRDHFRIFLFNVENRVMSSGDYKGYQYDFEAAFGGEAINSSNNQVNLKEFSADIPLSAGVSIKVGQFKVPVNLESADYEGNLLFSERSNIMQLFFNTGYDMGLALHGKAGNVDAIIGTLSGAPNLPQRYLPEVFNIPVIIARLGYSDGIQDDPFYPLQTGFTKPEQAQFAVHLNGLYIKDSNTGHSTNMNLVGSYFSTFSANGDYGNAMWSTLYNPYLSIGGTAPVTAQYWTAGADLQLRTLLGDSTLAFQAQVNLSHFDTIVPATAIPITILGQRVNAGDTKQLNIGGGEFQVSLGESPLQIAGRFAVVIPDNGMKTAWSYSTKAPQLPVTLSGMNPLFGSDPIYEVTFPAITWNMNQSTKLIAEMMWLLDTPEVTGDDGTYLLTEQPATTSSGPVKRAGLVPAGRMMFQFQI